MNVPIKQLILSSVCGSFLMHYLPVAQENPRYKSVTVALFCLQFLIWAVWRIFIYPKYMSPLRHLPGPKVSRLLKLYTFVKGSIR
jgi:hypothetical protein